ncbi:MAG TPA: FAD-dependent monooxygenase [Woeseiaceae bacterium]|nr:FAD-dependent monooxygenase [Woeseiaceae bacterium]
MSRTFEIVVVGGGVSGLSIALLLAHSRHADRFHLRLLDAAERPVFDPGSDIALRVSAISPGSRSILEVGGAWSGILQQRVSPYEHMRVWDESAEPDGPATLRFDADRLAVPQLGYIVENCLLQHGLLSVLDESGVDLQFATALHAVEESGNGRLLQLDNGMKWSADLVIAADGARSAIRTAAGIGVATYDYSQTAFVTHLVSELPHQRTAWQRFLRSGPLALLPLADGRVSTVWSTSQAQAEQAASVSDAELGELLTEASGGVLGRLEVAGPRGRFPLIAQHAREYVRPGLVLIGDAAHSIHPLAGQGANLGLADAATLATLIDDAVGRGEYPGDRPVLRRYERSRRGENELMMQSLTGLNRLFASDSGALGELRNAGMRLFNHAGPLRDYIARVALGARRSQ